MSPSAGEAVLEMRKRLGMTRAQLGELLAVTPRTIQRWECGESSVHPIYLARLRAMMQSSAQRAVEALQDANAEE